jgi:tetratricopeptide (TPR) repeat protein
VKRSTSAWLIAAGLCLASGCSSTETRKGWSGTSAGLTPWKSQNVSKEFKEAKRTLNHPEKTLLLYAQMKEDNEEYPEAIDRYREILVAYPNSVPAQLGISRIEMATGRFQQAEEQLDSLVRQKPDDAEVRMAQGQLYAKLEDWNKCIAAYEEACRLKPGEQVPRFELGIACVKAGRINDGIPHLNFAVGESAAMYNIGYVLQDRGQTQEAVGWYQQALTKHPDSRTKQRAEQMLSQLQPGASSSSEASLMASRSNRPAAGSGQASAFQTLHRANSGNVSPQQQAVAQYSVAPVIAPAGSTQVSTASSGGHRSVPGSAGPFRTASYAAPADDGNTSTSPSPVQTVSGSFTAVPQPQNSVSQWNGPTGSRTSSGRSGTTPRIGQQQPTQDPPLWRQKATH